MTPVLRTAAVFAISSPCLLAATATINLGIGQLRNAAGTILADGGGTWAFIVAAGQPGNPQTAGALPGGLTMDSSLTTLNIDAARSAFDGVSLTVGTKGSYYIQAVGTINGVATSGFEGAPLSVVVLPVLDGSDPGFTTGTLWGFYWFPGTTEGQALAGSFEVGGFANSRNADSGGTDLSDAGTTIPAAGFSGAVNFFETNFNQTTLGGPATGLSASRFTAVAVPEPATLTLSALGLGALLRRRRK